jgi:hypothetical protein
VFVGEEGEREIERERAVRERGSCQRKKKVWKRREERKNGDTWKRVRRDNQLFII